ncbi:MAG: hypothetical protein FJX74_01500 [Armatimonadetes bacterium]|nr:hypothetical protein [Armatimonadota bacterium]
MRSNVLLFWTGQASALLASAIVGGLLARVLGRSGLGVYVVIQTAAAAAAVVLSFGLTHALLYHVGGNKSRLERYIQAINSYGLTWAVFLNLAAAAAWVAGWTGGLTGGELVATANIIAVQHFGLFPLAILMARENFVALSAATVISSLLHIALVGVAAALRVLSVDTALLALWGALAAKTLLMALPARLLRVPLRPELRPLTELLGVSIRAHAYTVLQLLSESSGVLLLRAFSSTAEVGLFSRAAWLVSLPLLAARGASNVLWSRVAALGSASGRQIACTRKMLATTAALLVAACTAIAVVGRPVLVLINGPAYAQAYPLALMLLPGLVGAALWQVVMGYYAGKGYNLLTIGAAAVAVLLGVVLQACLSPRYASVGAAFSVSSAHVITGAVLLVAFLRETSTGPVANAAAGGTRGGSE